MVKKTDRKFERTRRHIRVRRKISGTAERPRLCIYRSNTNLYVQVIDDVAGNTLVAASTLDKEVKTKHANKEAAKELGTLIAKRAAEKNIPAYYVFTNDELSKIIQLMPKTVEELKDSKILTDVKVNAHGKLIVDVIREFLRI